MILIEKLISKYGKEIIKDGAKYTCFVDTEEHDILKDMWKASIFTIDVPDYSTLYEINNKHYKMYEHETFFYGNKENHTESWLHGFPLETTPLIVQSSTFDFKDCPFTKENTDRITINRYSISPIHNFVNHAGVQLYKEGSHVITIFARDDIKSGEVLKIGTNIYKIDFFEDIGSNFLRVIVSLQGDKEREI